MPLTKFRDSQEAQALLGEIHNPSHYGDHFPEEWVRQLRIQRLSKYTSAFTQYQIPVAELPEMVTLSEVCDIFNVLNTTGTKVSTFDLIHNLLFKDSDSEFELRETFKSLQNDTAWLKYLCDERRQEFINQLVTGCYLSEEVRIGRDEKTVSSLKSGDLIQTPLHFYKLFAQSKEKIDTYACDLFGEVLEDEFKLSDIPYPASLILYFSLRWRIERQPNICNYTGAWVSTVFKAFYWRNVLAGRYDQGFLTKFSDDLSRLHSLLNESVEPGDIAKRKAKANAALEALIPLDLSASSIASDILLKADIVGAQRKIVELLLHSRVSKDLLSADKLDKYAGAGEKKVELHHLYPKAWYAAVIERVEEEDAKIEAVNCLANLLPMTSKSNKEWRADDPVQVLSARGVTYGKDGVTCWRVPSFAKLAMTVL